MRRARWLAVALAGMLVALGWGYHQYANASAALAASHLREGLERAARGDLDEAVAFLAAAARLNGGSPVVHMVLVDALARAPRIVSELRHEDIVILAEFKADGTRVTASNDGRAWVWEAATGQALGAPLRHGPKVLSAAFSADGTRVVTASDDGTARVWHLMPHSAVTGAC